MTPLGWFCAVLGLLTGMTLVSVVVVDVMLSSFGRKTISRWVLEQTFEHPLRTFAVLLVVSNMLSLAMGILIGHLVFYQTLP